MVIGSWKHSQRPRISLWHSIPAGYKSPVLGMCPPSSF